ncbi:glycolate oxidase subunit GlcE [Undibacterium sp. 5I1]|uniref:glycolate oxidase subunit GlcE n=1 Tax=unclassified Undibacterium TaxID=2630295 RepID=UPI002AB57173|nr:MULTISPECIES: glycolate oxidase subunit GlcE [unclassified Undibacterium]MDY7538878.1 glycolate oxidase subunit GlcE [Undibacterium sp. 5I1]MEB0231004.1 glycolate oxidase subunit GlcE [Undibacterium sp. 10I3]MEB0257813.1 glycolate oxidase subunit GlcE [Undibacterium sp. 5I1]
MENILQDFRERIQTASAQKTALRIQGGASKSWYGQQSVGELLDTRAYTGIVAYEPTELVITARCGTPLAQIEAALDQHHQMLAFEPPRFNQHATLGGMLAAGLSGPRRATVGAVRDFVLGANLMDGRGELLHFGGQVMKNVAGYDVSRLLAGSMGTLGLITDISIKVLPKPFAETTLVFALSEAEALTRLNQWGGQALPISASAWHVGRLMLRLSGAEAAIRSAKKQLGGEEVKDAASYWHSLREQTHKFFAQDDEHGLWRLSFPSSAAPAQLTGKSMIEWGGAQRWLFTDENPQHIRDTASRAGGHASLFRAGDKSVGVFAPLAPAVAKIHRNLKAAFDPAGIFNPGRMYLDL